MCQKITQNIFIIREDYKMLMNRTLKSLLDTTNGHPEVKLILTGRNAPDFAVERAGLVSEVKCVKHYYTQGRPPKKGIEF